MFFSDLESITIGMITIYFIFLYLLSFNLTNLFNLVTKYLKNHRNKAKLMCVHDILREIEYNINEFESLFSVIPFSITINFSTATYHVLHLTTENSIRSIIDFTIDHIVLILYLSFISKNHFEGENRAN